MGKVRCYAYTRVSTSMQVDAFSLKAQTEKIHRYAEYQNMEIVEEFSDEGKSGKSVIGRTAFQEMFSKIENGIDRVSFVLVFKLSRFGRNASDVLNSLQIMQDNGVNLICIEDGIDSSKDSGKLMISILSAVAEIERENILVQTMEGRKQKAREGKWNGGFAPYGYDLINGELVINEEKAKIVKIIFEKFAYTTMGFGGVADYLNQLGYKKEKKVDNHLELFSIHFIKGILDNPVYNGKIAYGRRKAEKINGTRNEYHIVKQKDYMLVDGIHQKIIDDDLWNIVRKKREKTGISNIKKHSLDHESILSGILKCPVCDAGMYCNNNRKKDKDGNVKDRFYYSCKHRRMVNENFCDYKKQWKQETIDNAVEEFISKLIKNPKFKEALDKKINTKIDLAEIEKEIENLEKTKNQFIGAKSKLGFQMDSLDINDKFYNQKYSDMEERLNRLYEQIENVDDKINTLNQRIESIKQDKLSSESIYRILEYFDTLYNKFTDKEKKQFMQVFIERIDIFEEQQKDGRILRHIKFKFPVLYNDKMCSEFSWDNENHVETVILLSHISNEHIDIDINLDKLDLTSAESKATYKEIKEYVKQHTGLTVSTLNIAQIKQKCGIIERDNYNKPKSNSSRQPNCTEEKEKAIIEAFKHFKMI